MSVIYLRHQVHGNKVACSEEEAVADEKNGWTRYSVKAATVTVTHVAEPTASTTAATLNDLTMPELVEMYTQKFGKKPHHKKSETTIRGELAALGPFRP